jgi:hypothetical protein
MSTTFKPTHEVTIPVVLNAGWWETQNIGRKGSISLICAGHPLVTVRELPRPIEAGDWVTITGWKNVPPGEVFEVLHVSDNRAWIKDAKGFNSLINIEDIKRTAF